MNGELETDSHEAQVVGEAAREAGPPLVLVVDHDENVVRLLAHKLPQAGFAVVAAAEASEGLELALERHPDVVLYAAARHRAGEFVAALAETFGTRAPVVIMLAGAADPEAVREALQQGCDDYVTKPFSPTDLLHRILVARLRRELRREPGSVEEPAWSP